MVPSIIGPTTGHGVKVCECTSLVIVVFDVSMDVSVVWNTIGVSSGVIINMMLRCVCIYNITNSRI